MPCRRTPEVKSSMNYHPDLEIQLNDKSWVKLGEIIQKAVTEARLADKQMLVSELRNYYKKYPEADFMDISGYIVGFYARPTLKNQDKKNSE